jgi:cell division protein FtsL
MYLGFRQYQLLFDLVGLAILMAIICCAMTLAWFAYRRKPNTARAMAVVVAALYKR